jgi:hypothetical protein
LAAAELLRLVPTCFFEPTGEECGTVYDEATACSICGAGRRQVTDLELSIQKIPKRADIAVSIASEWVFSKRLAEVVQGESISGVVLRAVRHHGRGTSKVSPDWLQPVVTSMPVKTVSPTRFGLDPLNDDPKGEYRCSLGHVAGLNILSEIYLARSTWHGEDVVQTEQLVGDRRGLVVPSPMTLISQRFYQSLTKAKMRGFKVEVAHLS